MPLPSSVLALPFWSLNHFNWVSILLSCVIITFSTHPTLSYMIGYFTINPHLGYPVSLFFFGPFVLISIYLVFLWKYLFNYISIIPCQTKRSKTRLSNDCNINLILFYVILDTYWIWLSWIRSALSHLFPMGSGLLKDSNLWFIRLMFILVLTFLFFDLLTTYHTPCFYL